MDNTIVITLLKYASGVLVILLLVFLIAVITPKLAAFIDKRRNAPSPAKGEEYIEPKDYTVRGPYDKSEKLEDFDPNYKIYNEDIYGFNRKNKTSKENK